MNANTIKPNMKVAAIDGPGQGLAFPARSGVVESVTPTRWGTIVAVKFEDGTSESFNATTFRHENEDPRAMAIGVYIVEGGK